MENRDDTWPALPLDSWIDTRDTVQLWTQIVGKTRIALGPEVNHWWGVPLYVDARGLTTSLMVAGGRGLEIRFDFVNHELLFLVTDGSSRRMALESRTVADFYAEYTRHLEDLGFSVQIVGTPVELPEAIPFAEDTTHASYDSDAVSRFWTSLVSAHGVLSTFRGAFRGKSSPVHFFWGPSTWPSPGSPDAPPRSTPAASRTVRTG